MLHYFVPMPTLAVLGRIRIRMFADDHNPPHFHVVAPDGEVMVALDGLKVLRGRLRRDDLEAALVWARSRQRELSDEWHRLNG